MLVAENISNRLRRRFLAAVLRQDIPWFDSKPSGSFATKLFDNLERVKEGTGEKIGMMIQFLAQMIGGFTVAFVKDWRLTLVLLALVPFLAICAFFISKMISQAEKDSTENYSAAGAVAEQALTSIRTVIAFNGQQIEADKYDKELAKGRQAGLKKAAIMAIGLAVTFLSIFSSYCLAFWVGTDFVYYGSMEGGAVLTVFFAVMMGSMALGAAGPILGTISVAKTAAGQLYSIIDRVPEIDASSEEGLKPVGLEGSIKVENVHFSYPTRPEVEVLKGLSLDVKTGQTVALVGPSGSGKSSLIQLLLRYYNPLGGKITIDGIGIEQLNICFLRNLIGVVSQEPVLFNTTIEENIKFGRWDVSKWEIEDALRKANAFDFVESFPDGLNTIVGDRGTQLSGGQKQRLAIARALVRNPKILLLDEATSALDTESESIVQTALENASKGRTTLVIAHRLSTIRNADLIVAMKDGSVVETGTHDELVEKKGLYFDLVNAQMVAEEPKTARAVSPRPTSARFSRSVSHETPRHVFEMKRLKSQSSTLPDAAEGVDKKELEATREDVDRLKHELKEEGATRATLWQIIRYARPEWGFLSLALCFSALQGVIFPAFSLFFAQILSVFSNPDLEEMRSQGHQCAIAFCILGVAQAFFALTQTMSFGVVAEKMTERMRSRVFRNVLRGDGTYFDAPIHAPGKIVTRLATDAPNVKSAIDSRLGALLGEIVSDTCGLAISFYFGWQMAIPVIAVFSLAGLLQSLRMRYVTAKTKEAEKEMENSGKTALEAIEHIRTVQALTLQNRIHQQFCSHLDGPFATSRQKAVIQGFAQGISTAIFYFLFAGSFRLGLWLILGGYLDPMDVIKVMFAISFTAGGLGMISNYLPDYLKSTLAAGLIFKMMREEPEIDQTTTEGSKPAIEGRIKLDGIVFQYPERPETSVLQGLDIEIIPGKTLALCGPSGCGKSTVICLLERLYNPMMGTITVDGTNVQQINPTHLREHVALVSQEPVLFDCSIRENIVYGMTEGSFNDDDVYEAAKKANIHKFIIELPQGYDTAVGDRGTQLSGGQKQRLAIARALIRNPKVLLLDEATSALDTESEALVQEALDRASEGRGVLVIAHRLSTIQKADKIVVVVNGKAVEEGTHEELMRRKGAYWNLQQKQNGKH